MTEQFEQFIKERQFISNVSPRTIQWYRESFAWLDNPEPTNDELKAVGEPVNAAFLVAIEDLVSGLARDPKLPALFRHGLAS